MSEPIVPQGQTRYPKNGMVLLLSKHNENTGSIALLCDELRRRRDELAEFKVEVTERPSGMDYLLSEINKQNATSAILVDELVKADQRLAELRAQKAAA